MSNRDPYSDYDFLLGLYRSPMPSPPPPVCRLLFRFGRLTRQSGTPRCDCSKVSSFSNELRLSCWDWKTRAVLMNRAKVRETFSDSPCSALGPKLQQFRRYPLQRLALSAQSLHRSRRFLFWLTKGR
jgi:hypothetical protein